jgi:hypothetical protein
VSYASGYVQKGTISSWNENRSLQLLVTQIGLTSYNGILTTAERQCNFKSITALGLIICKKDEQQDSVAYMGEQQIHMMLGQHFYPLKTEFLLSNTSI